jgi:hypothetical protein
MKHCCKYLCGLRYKIRMMGIPLEHCCFIYGDNKSVLFNTTIPDSTLKRKHRSIAYHFVREGSLVQETNGEPCIYQLMIIVLIFAQRVYLTVLIEREKFDI